MMSKGMSKSETVIAAIVIVVAIVVLNSIIPRVGRPVSPIGICQARLLQLAKALEMYHADFGSFPPAYVADENGKPMYSWRVLLLPYLGENAMHHQFDFSQSWDSLKNEALVEVYLPILVCPSRSGDRARDATTSYLALNGPNTAWRGSKPVSKTDLGDDLSKIILRVEVADSQIPWAQPKDVTLAAAAAGINESDMDGISSFHERGWAFRRDRSTPGAHVLFADGSIRYFRKTHDEEELIIQKRSCPFVE